MVNGIKGWEYKSYYILLHSQKEMINHQNKPNTEHKPV